MSMRIGGVFVVINLCINLGSRTALARNLHVLTVSSDFNIKMIPMLLSAQHSGYTVSLVGGGGGNNGNIWGRQLGWKLNSLHNFTSKIPDDDVVLYVDARDVLFVDPPNLILNKFVDMMSQTGKTIFISGEELPGFRAADHPITKFRYRYMNSGGIIGLASGFKLLLQDPPPNMLPSRYVTDQDWIIDVYLNTSGLGGFMGIDSSCEFFQVTCRVNSVQSSPKCPLTQDAVDIKDGQLTNRITMTHPSILHLPGAGHWAIGCPLAEIMNCPRYVTCHYYEVARTLMPDEFRKLEEQRLWSGQAYSGICTGDSLLFHVVKDNVIYIGLRVGLGLLVLGFSRFTIWCACRKKLKHVRHTYHEHAV